MINVQIADSILASGEEPPVKSGMLESAVQETLRYAQAPAETEMTLVLTGDAQLQELNRQFLGIDAPTDVLSFPSGETDPESGVLYLGDVLISYPRAAGQAAAGGHSIEDELRLLVVHGVLHLLGHDHAEEEEQAAMWAAQSEILARLGSSISSPPLYG